MADGGVEDDGQAQCGDGGGVEEGDLWGVEGEVTDEAGAAGLQAERPLESRQRTAADEGEERRGDDEDRHDLVESFLFGLHKNSFVSC